VSRLKKNERWVTLPNGARILIDDDEIIIGGMGGEHDGQSLAQAFGDKSKDLAPITDLNPTGGVFVDYTAEDRASAPLGANIVPFSETSGLNPNEPVTVYRGVPQFAGDDIVSGDFVTTNPQLAKDYAGDGGKILSLEVTAQDILDDRSEPLGEEYILRIKRNARGDCGLSTKSKLYVNEKLNLQRKTLDGVKYLVAPVVMVREQVLNGEFLPADEIEKSVPGWNGRPVVCHHPKSCDGDDVTANSPDSIPDYEVGRIFNVSYDPETTKLKGEAWLDIAKMSKNKETKAAYDMILKNKCLEVSTGYFVNSPQSISGNHNEVEYTAVQRDILPDHLALLPGDVGACSWEDGAGIRHNSRNPVMAALDTIKNALLKNNDQVNIMEKLNVALQERDPSVYYTHSNLYDTEKETHFVIYEKQKTDSNGAVVYRDPDYYRQDYTISDNGDISLSGWESKVERQTSFVSANAVKSQIMLAETVLGEIQKIHPDIKEISELYYDVDDGQEYAVFEKKDAGFYKVQYLFDKATGNVTLEKSATSVIPSKMYADLPETIKAPPKPTARHPTPKQIRREPKGVAPIAQNEKTTKISSGEFKGTSATVISQAQYNAWSNGMSYQFKQDGYRYYSKPGEKQYTWKWYAVPYGKEATNNRKRGNKKMPFGKNKKQNKRPPAQKLNMRNNYAEGYESLYTELNQYDPEGIHDYMDVYEYAELETPEIQAKVDYTAQDPQGETYLQEVIQDCHDYISYFQEIISYCEQYVSSTDDNFEDLEANMDTSDMAENYEGDDDEDVTVKKLETAKAKRKEIKSNAQYIQSIPDPDLRASMIQQEKWLKTHRHNMVKSIMVANRQWTQNELNTMPTTQLEKVMSSLRLEIPDYGIRGMQTNKEEDKGYTPMTNNIYKRKADK